MGTWRCGEVGGRGEAEARERGRQVQQGHTVGIWTFPCTPPKAKEWCSLLLEAILAAHGGGLEGVGGEPSAGASPGEEAAREGRRRTQDVFGAYQAGLSGKL